MAEQELRKEKRYLADYLPTKYTNFTILLPNEFEDTVITIDISLIGFGVITNLPKEYYVVGTRIVLYPLGTDKPLYGNVIYSEKIESVTRVGIEIMPLGKYEIFKKELEEIFYKLNQ